MQKLTKPTRAKDIQRAWHHIDIQGKVLGRIATVIAQKLMGKEKTYFVKNLDCGDHVVVTNSKKVQVTGRKHKQKIYTRYSGYPGGLRNETFEELIVRRPNEVIRHAVYGMLPKNKLRDRMIKRLHVFPEEKHTFESKFKTESSNN